MPASYEIGPFRLDSEAETLFRGDQTVAVGQRATALLIALVERAGRPVSKEVLIEAAWPGLAVEESNLTVQIAALRRVFATESGGERWIETLPRRGYRFVGPVEPAVTGDDPAVELSADAASELPLPDKPSIAVLPFQNISNDPDQDYFVDGIVEDIIAGLSRIKWFFVIARNSSFAYKGKGESPDRIGRELGVRYLLEGSVRKAGDRVRITAQLIQAETAAHLWAERYDRTLDDIFALQDEIAMSVVGAIEPNLRKVEIERVKRMRPENLDAYDLVIRALPFVYQMMPGGAATAVPLLEKALQLEPDYPIANAVIAWCYHFRFRGEGDEGARQAALYHARAATAGGTDDAAALSISGLVIWFDERDDTTAFNLFDRALALSSSNVLALGCSAVALAWKGQTDDAIQRAESALRLSPFDPLNYLAYNALSASYFYLERYEEARDAALRAIDSNRHFSVPQVLLTAALTKLGAADEAERSAKRVLTLDPTFTISRFALTNNRRAAVFDPFAEALRTAGLPE